ncbi:DUF2163 domain-containing protein [Sphingomonas lacunae]|uniref:DUF2163 domain-containing protein n=1 Tax=Sphingomonas lacunae TaxID=2698828 RepID=A0A6M4AWH2_9SPHN|nr:DUF2163 domain-containing protein [Sphingomonas lacunae]QJQ32389.1 DUF2163 domain-containing protein [Sphingomonas lacunae]
MSRAIVAAPDWLTGEVATIAWLWRIVRRDGVMLGLTTHDSPIRRDGLTYQPSPGIRPSAIRQRRGLAADSFTIEGALNSAAISEATLASGRWDGARLTLAVVDWQKPAVAESVVAEGMLGSVTSDGARFSAELGARDIWLDGPLVPETSAECRAELGDVQCRVALAPRTHRAVVTARSGDLVTLADAVGGWNWANGLFPFGWLRWLDGPGRGLWSAIIDQNGAVLTVAEVPDGAGQAGQQVELTEGCDKRAATCAARFANIANFRGEPHLPGMDLLTRFPGG